MGKTEPMENWKTEQIEHLHQPLCTFKCRNVIIYIIYEWPCINALSTEISSCLNGETEMTENCIWETEL